MVRSQLGEITLVLSAGCGSGGTGRGPGEEMVTGVRPDSRMNGAHVRTVSKKEPSVCGGRLDAGLGSRAGPRGSV